MSANLSARALDGLKVIDLGRVLAAPWAAQILGDFGADVIKVERPKVGDLGRQYGPATMYDADGNRTLESSFFLCANRNKRSMTLDFTTAEGQEILKQLAVKADVLIENYIPGTLDRYGLDYAALSQLNPRLIYCSVTGYGQNGPYRDRPGFDAVFQAHSGMMSVTGRGDDEPGSGPMKTGPSLVDVMTGYNAAIGVLAALARRGITGKGQHIDICLMDTAITCQSHSLANYLLSGEQLERRGTRGNGGGPAQVFPCGDGDIYISAGNDNNFVDLCNVLGMPELANDERYHTLHGRTINHASLTCELENATRRWSKKELMNRLMDRKVACAPILDYPELMTDPYMETRKLIEMVEHPLASNGVAIAGNPLRLSESPAEIRLRPPLLGEHTQEILREELGLGNAEIAALKERRIV